MFNTIGIITKPFDSVSKGKAGELIIFLEQQGVGVVLESEQISEQADLIIVVAAMALC